MFLFGSPVDRLPDNAITPTTLKPQFIDRLGAADHVVNTLLIKHNLVQKLSQVPVVLTPVSFDVVGGHSIVIRTFITNDFMTGVPAIPGTEWMPSDVLEEMVTEVGKCEGISRVMYDMTAKPPGTTEWE